ncbi:hypothetical protein D3C78_1538740 [compost metagenome]
MWQPTFGVQKNEVQWVLPHRLVIPLNDIDRLRILGRIHRINLPQRIPCGLQQPHLACRAPGFRYPISPTHFGSAKRHRPMLQIDILSSQGNGF